MGRLREAANRGARSLSRARSSAQEIRRSGEEKYDEHRVQTLRRRVERDETEAALKIRQAKAQRSLAEAEALTIGSQVRRKKAQAGLRETSSGSVLADLGEMFGIGKRKTSRASKRRKRTARRKP